MKLFSQKPLAYVSQRAKAVLLVLPILTFFGVCSPFLLSAGSGTITPAPQNSAGIRGLMNFTINFRYVPTTADVIAMEDAIRVANDAICDATDGQIVFGRVTITAGSINEGLADIWVLPNPGRSGVSMWTDGSGFGREGAHINLFSNGINGRVIAHELGHLAFGIGDEYDEQCRWGGPCGIGPCFDTANIDDRNNTIMANHNSMSELSVPGNHDPLVGDGNGCPSMETCTGTGICSGDACNGYNGNTGRYEASQNTLLNGGLSDWEVLDRNYPGLNLLIPILPEAAVPINCRAFLRIDSQVNGSSLVVLCLDDSYSMTIQDVGDRTRMEFAQAASRAFIDLQKNKNIDLGVVQFSTTASTIKAIEDLTIGNANSFKNNINALVPSGFTAIGDGLIESRVQLQVAQAVAAANGETITNPTILLMSDGQNNRGADPDAVAANLIDAGITIYSIPVGDGADTDLMADLASESGGVMLPANTADQLPAIYAELAARHQGHSLLNGEQYFEEHVFFEFPRLALVVPLEVEADSGPLTIFLGQRNVTDFNLENGNIARGVDIYDPTGVKLNANQYTNIHDAFYRIIQIPNTLQGTYTLYVDNPSLLSADVNVVSFVENKRPDLYIDAKPRRLSSPEPVQISASPIFETSLYESNISYVGKVTRPDGSVVSIDLEVEPLTGAVTAEFDNFNGTGSYRVDVQIFVPNGAGILPGESIFTTPSDFNLDVDAFTRVASTAFTLFQPGVCPPCSENPDDCDGDNIPNNQEDAYPDQDIDNDGLPNRCDQDSDGDDIPDQEESDLDLNQNDIPDVYERLEELGCTESTLEIFTVEVINPDCGSNNGRITIAAENAEGIISYRWSHTPNLNEPEASSLPSFIYSVTAEDESGCQQTLTINLTEDCSNITPPSDILVSLQCPKGIPLECEFPVVITADMTNAIAPNDRLGNFTGIMTWDPTILEYIGPAEILSSFNGFINLDEPNGKLIFNGANSPGIDGIMDIFKTRFRAIGPIGSVDAVNVEFISFAAASTFEDLLPELVVEECNYEILSPGILGDVNNDGLVTSTDGNIILSWDVGLTLPPGIQTRIDDGFGDVNQDGLTNSTDALIVLTYDAQFPVPYPVGEAFCPAESLDDFGSSDEIEHVIDIVIGVHKSTSFAQHVDLPVYADCSKMGTKLGSYHAVITWDTTKLQYLGIKGGMTDGFENLTFNKEALTEGQLTVAHANPLGKAGIVNLFNLKFKELQFEGLSSLSIEFGNMVSATDFERLGNKVKVEPEIDRFFPNAGQIHTFPNPFSSNLHIMYTIGAQAPVKVMIYDVLGQQIDNLFDAEQEAGTYQITWESGPLGTLKPGLLFVVVQVGDEIHTKRVLFVER